MDYLNTQFFYFKTSNKEYYCIFFLLDYVYRSLLYVDDRIFVLVNHSNYLDGERKQLI